MIHPNDFKDDNALISKIVDNISKVNVNQLSPEEGKSAMDNGNVLKKDTTIKVDLLSENGDLRLSLVLLSESQQFKNRIALVVKDKKCGYINDKGEFVVPLIYDYKKEILQPNNKMTTVIRQTEDYLISNEKEIVLVVEKDSKWGAIKIPKP